MTVMDEMAKATMRETALREEIDRLNARILVLSHRVRELEAALAAEDLVVQTAKETIDALHERLRLSDQERAVLAGRGDGCVRVAELRPIVRRIFGEAA